MKFTLSRTVAGLMRKAAGALSPVSSNGGWWPIVNEPYTGAWQKNDEIRCDTVLEAPALFSCVTLIAGDIAKLLARLVERQDWGGWTATESASFSPVLRKPNRYQNHIQFKEQWLISKLTRGNTYVLKERDARRVVIRLYVLDPERVKPLVAPDGAVYYQLDTDYLNGLPESVIVPSSEIIHDRFNCLFHPLIGLSPIYAAGLPALQSLKIGRHWSKFFGNNAQPGGILAAPGAISPANAEAIKTTWNSNYTGINAGKVAVIGDGMKYQPLSPSALDSQVIQQLQWGSETIAAVFHIPAYKINVGAVPSNTNVEALDSQYYTQCLQKLIEDFELCMDDGLGIGEANGKIEGRILGTDLDLSGLLRMDTTTKVTAAANSLKAGFMSPNEARAQFNLPPVAGGDTPYLQVQNYSLAALDERDETNPLATPPAPAAPSPAPSASPPDDESDAVEEAREFLAHLQKGLTHAA
jgi:HK97 family phage portal protein